MSIQRFTAENRTTINWASGTSTEIFIHPSHANFAERNFMFRISTATVETEESKFTYFEGITRHLMILKGELELVHEGRYSKQLKPFDQDTFSGEWSTHSKGKVTDFNLMLKGETTGALKHFRIESGSEATFAAKATFNFLYIASGTAFINDSLINTGDLICIEKDALVTVHTEKHCDLIEIEVEVNELTS